MRSGLVRSLVFWYAVIVFATFGVLNLTVSGIIEANNEKNIEEELLGHRESSEVFLSRYVLKNGVWGYQEAGDSLCAVLGSNLKIYSTTGELLYNSLFSEEDLPTQDLDYAKQGKSAYTIYPSGDFTGYISPSRWRISALCAWRRIIPLCLPAAAISPAWCSILVQASSSSRWCCLWCLPARSSSRSTACGMPSPS